MRCVLVGPPFVENEGIVCIRCHSRSRESVCVDCDVSLARDIGEVVTGLRDHWLKPQSRIVNPFDVFELPRFQNLIILSRPTAFSEMSWIFDLTLSFDAFVKP